MAARRPPGNCRTSGTTPCCGSPIPTTATAATPWPGRTACTQRTTRPPGPGAAPTRSWATWPATARCYRRPTPPCAWLLYQYVGLTPASRAAARQRWLGLFPPSRGGDALAWGRAVEAQRRQAGEPLPPSCDNVALVCAVERLTGTDAQGCRLRRVVADERRRVEADFPRWHLGRVINYGTWFAVRLAYPTDDLFYLTFSAHDPLNLCGVVLPDLWPERWWVPPLVAGVLLVLVMFGLRSFSLTFLPQALYLVTWPVVLLTGQARTFDRRLEDYVEGQEKLDGKGVLIGYVLTPLVAWVMAWFTLDNRLRLLILNPGWLFLGVLASVCLGGTVVLMVTRLVAVLLIHLGFDVERTWVDEVLGTVAGALVMRYFGNDWPSVAAFVAFAAVPELLARRQRVRDRDAGADRAERRVNPYVEAKDYAAEAEAYEEAAYGAGPEDGEDAEEVPYLPEEGPWPQEAPPWPAPPAPAGPEPRSARGRSVLSCLTLLALAAAALVMAWSFLRHR